MIDGVGAKVEGMAELTRRFKNLRADVAKSDDDIMQKNADEFAAAVEAATERGKTGHQRASVKATKKGPRLYYVSQGGALTRKRVKRGQSPVFDYTRAGEFGTQDMPANPAFWPTYRRLKRRFRTRINAGRRALIKAFRL
ncbi:HK97-gp10 family putative phage morphogenesis protein [Caulobacter sp.]|uniref:HK97-gp10 family putative phage morphogenesis protein n=1 Tax=Caulobacter sp. TaxID=78 RepID=UPI003BAE1830